MSIHPRYYVVQKADSKIRDAIIDAVAEFDLTYGEEVQILSNLLLNTAKYLIRSERHPNDPEAKGDEA